MPTTPTTVRSFLVLPPVRRTTLEYTHPEAPRARKRATTTEDMPLVYLAYIKMLTSWLFLLEHHGQAQPAYLDDGGILPQ